MIQPSEEYKKHMQVLQGLEALITSQTVPYNIHVERLENLKVLHQAIEELRLLKSKVNEKEEPPLT